MHQAQAFPNKCRTRCLICLALATLAAAFAWWEGRSVRSMRSRLAIKAVQVATMNADATRILAMQSAPHRAADRDRPNEALNAQIEQARQTARLPSSAIQAIDPMPPRRPPQSDYKEMPTLVRLDKVTLQLLVGFIHELTAADPSLDVVNLRILTRQRDDQAYDVELTVSYLIYSPQRKATST